MSTERPDNDVTSPRRRSPLAVASVAAAVLLAGGGGAYWAATAADSGSGGDTSGPADSGDGSPPVLSLDDGTDGTDGPTTPSVPPKGIAPGEPDPHGTRTVYRVSGELPQGPGRASVHRAKGTVSAAEVTRLAVALGLEGTPRMDGPVWKIGSDKDGSGPYLRVDRQAPGTWTFSRYGTGGTDNCPKGAVCANKRAAPGGGGSPVGEGAAKAAAVPVLKAAGQKDAATDAGQLMGSVRVVNADPVVDGLPTYGWSTGIQVGSGGEVVGGSGHLKSLDKGAEYPVISAGEALKELNGSSSRSRGGIVGGCATSAPLGGDVKTPKGGTESPENTCGARTGAERPTTTVTIDKAAFGLAARYVEGEQVLVPSWLFTTRQPAGGRGTVVPQVAVDPAFLAKGGHSEKTPDSGDPTNADHQLRSYRADGRTLSVTFWGGVCATYTAHAEESADTVRVSVTRSEPDGKKVCVAIAKELTRKVTLDAPVGDRKVIDAASGDAVPRG